MSKHDTAYTLIGGALTAGTRLHKNVILGAFDVITLDHEDGRMEFTEDEAMNLIGALSVQLTENRRRRREEVPALRERTACDLAYLDARPCPSGSKCRYPR